MLEIVRTITPGWQDPMRRNEVCYGSAAEIPKASSEVRFTPKSGHGSARSWFLLCARSKHSAASLFHPRTRPRTALANDS